MIITIDMTSGDTIEEAKQVQREVKQNNKNQSMQMPRVDVGLQHFEITTPSADKRGIMPESLAKEDLDKFIYKMQK